MAAATNLTEASADLGATLSQVIPHVVQTLLLTENAQNFTASGMTSYEILFSSTHISIHHCNTLNPITLLPHLKERESQDCHAFTQFFLPWPDLLETHLENQDSELFVNELI